MPTFFARRYHRSRVPRGEKIVGAAILVILAAILRRRLGPGVLAGAGLSLLRIVVATAAMGLAAW
ncbi:hypothetical protein LCGC14_1723830, partial [marine sediment metagenome]